MLLILLFALLQVDPKVENDILSALSNMSRFQVHFRQETYSDFFDPTVAKGTLIIQRPGKMRMEYTKGEQRIIIWDGQTTYERDILADTEERLEQKEIKDEPLVRLLLYGDNLKNYFLMDRVKDQKGDDLFRLRPRSHNDYIVEIRFDEAYHPIYINVLGEDGEGTRFWFDSFQAETEITADTFSIPEVN